MLLLGLSKTLFQHFGCNGAFPEELWFSVRATEHRFSENDRVAGDDIAGAVEWIVEGRETDFLFR